MAEDSQGNQIKQGWIKTLLALSIPIPYVQGFAYYEGQLEPYSIGEPYIPFHLNKR